MLSSRLNAIANFISLEDKVIDVGCDHALLSIYLCQNHLCKSVIASDINKNALMNAKKNIKNAQLSIKTFECDGIKNISKNLFDTIVISGMGANTILHILEDNKDFEHVNKIILQSNNDYYYLRKKMNKKGFYLLNENVVKERKKYYVTMLFVRKNKCNTRVEQKFGLLKKDKKEYYNELIFINNNILNNIPKKRFILRIKYKINIYNLTKMYKKTI